MADLRVGGLSRLSTCDWPGELVATVFCQGCPWACPYCHNPDLLPARGQRELAWEQVLAFLEGRRGLLDGVVFSGGEATLQAALPDAMRTVRGMGFRIGLHTGGPYPERLADLLPLLDWVGFDVKAPFAEYERITGASGSGERARESLRLLLDAGIACDVRTTVHPRLLDAAALERLRADLDALGVRQHRLQPFRATGCRPDQLARLSGDAPCAARPA
ncbi:anaerobic ribonucleoside-triphosphate reductase activating protein [Rhodospirillum centenum]|uniref:Anaerobic ribonucleoside-triphosphate reductase activating protein n=1 Tax=Rhodospirillum centenum (strain ATCC 51521 / SW) TaxID=414684 RepID=B6IQN0_RHOCS|nr:anaerobic ribonucleoside-triphosphate reductase activating protein [Rhodospirillum centenum]ACI97766.1 anaerobic ribonucleoside-triphosphate reductase activating protein [Rhodospirillum centenum SW]